MAPVTWFRRKAGRTQQQAENEAKRLQRLSEEKEKYVTVDAPGDLTVRATSSLTLTGTGTAFDQTYQIETVEHRFSVGGGYTMSITAKNSGKGDSGYTGGTGDAESPPSGSDTSIPDSSGFSGFTNPVTGNPVGSPGTV